MRAVLALAFTAGCSIVVDPPDAVHPEVVVNSIVDLDQSNPSAVLAGERYFVVWQDSSQTAPDTSEDAVRGRFLDKTGVPEGSDLLVNDPNNSRATQDEPRVAASGTSLLVVWTDHSGLGTDADPGIHARGIAATGEFVSADVLVNTTVTGAQDEPVVVATKVPDSFLIVWTDASGLDEGKGIRARRIRTDGIAEDPADFPVNMNGTGDQTEASIARGLDNRFMTVWTDTPVTGTSDIHGRMLDEDGTPLGGDIVINTTLAGAQLEPFVIGIASGGYLVCWTDGSAGPGDAEGNAVRARVFDQDGKPLADDYVLNATTAADQAHPFAITRADGSIFVVYEDTSAQSADDSGSAVRARTLAADGAPTGDEILVNTFFGDDQEDPTLARDADGNVLVVWEDGSAPSPDNSGDAVQARIFAP